MDRESEAVGWQTLVMLACTLGISACHVILPLSSAAPDVATPETSADDSAADHSSVQDAGGDDRWTSHDTYLADISPFDGVVAWDGTLPPDLPIPVDFAPFDTLPLPLDNGVLPPACTGARLGPSSPIGSRPRCTCLLVGTTTAMGKAMWAPAPAQQNVQATICCRP